MNVCVVEQIRHMRSLLCVTVVVIIWFVQTGLCAISDLKRVFDDNSWRKFTIAGAVAPNFENIQLSSAINYGHVCTFRGLLCLLITNK